MNIYYYFLLTNFFIYSLYGQYPKDFFSSPINHKIAIAGTFGELRNNHFHSGIDIKTKQRKNIPIYAAQDGYISRIKISTHGFGKALYIKHKYGFTTVYAHLQKFEPSLEKYITDLFKMTESLVLKMWFHVQPLGIFN